MDVLQKIRKFLSYWFLRYTLVTEMYMVETWEKITIHIILAVIFGLFWYFNYTIIMTGVAQLRGSATTMKTMDVNN